MGVKVDKARSDDKARHVTKLRAHCIKARGNTSHLARYEPYVADGIKAL
jgi:hypothetical protein